MRRYLIGLTLLLLGKVHASYEIHEITLKNHVTFLTSEALEGRMTGSLGEQRATEYIAKMFQNLGLEPAGDLGTFFQEFNVNSALASHSKKGRNVLGALRVGKQTFPMIVIGAHLDHLGKDRKHQIYPGADDNASGVGAVLEVAAKLSDLKAQGKLQGNKDILFAAWSGEEIGVLGSSHFVTHQLSSIEAAINLDMVGHLRERLVIQGVGSSEDWPELIKVIQKQQAIKLITQNDPYLPTDSTAFYIHGVPTLNFFTGAHDAYHTTRDTADALNYKGIKQISEFLVELLLAIEKRSNAIVYNEVQPSKDKLSGGFKIYLGTIPDYAGADVAGVKLSGVANNSPAAKAGMRQDDLIVELAGKKIGDIYEYTKVLNSLKVDKPTTLIIVRKKRRIELTIVPQYRT